MTWPQCNSTLEDQAIQEDALWHGWTFHKLSEWVAAGFALIALAVSFILIWMHALHYSRPHEQRHIVRILFMVPVYAAVSFLSIKYYLHSVYYEVLRDCYEAFAIASFFSLLCAYIADDLHDQKEYFRTITPRNWIWPVPWFQKCCGGDRGIWRKPRSGLTLFNVIWVGVFQYCFIRVFMTIVSVITQALKRYCLESLNPAFAHVWVMVIEAGAVSIAMYCLIQFYIQIRRDIAKHKPLLKIIAIKLVIFLSFWQTIAISFLTSAGAVKPSDHIKTPDIKVGIPGLLLCIEMAIFSVFHIFAFPWNPYSLSSKTHLADSVPGEPEARYHGGFLGFKAIVDAMNPWDMIKAIGRAAKWLFRDRRHRHLDVSYDLSRKVSQNSTVGVPKPEVFNGQTSYGAPKPAHYGGGDPSEGQTLLMNGQAMGKTMTRPDTSPYRQPSAYRTESNEGYRGADIGVATTSFDNQPRYAAYGGQETGVAPYPDRGRPGQVQQPYFPPPPSSMRKPDNMF